MIKCLSLSVIRIVILITGFTSTFAQQLPKQLPLGKPRVIDFQQLANYRLAHPLKKKKRAIEQIEDVDKDFKYTPRPVGSSAISFDIKAPQNNSRSISPSPNVVFNGPIDNTGIVPPDVNAAAGDNYVMATTNQEFDIYSKTGALVSTLDIPTFFSGVNVDVEFSDPHVDYDATYNRFIVVIDPVELSDYNDDGGWGIAVSKTNDPTGQWYVYTFDAGVSEAGGALLDYPLLGYNKKWVTITGNLFANAVTAEIYVFNRAELYSGTLGTVSTFTDANVYTYAPAQTYDTSVATEYLVTDYNGNQSDGKGYMEVSTITGPVNAPVYTAGNPLGVSSTWDENEVDANQLGGATPISTNGTGPGNAIFRNGQLWFTHTVYLPTGAPTCSSVDWWEVNPVTPSVTQYGRISDPNAQIFYFFPSINVDSAGDALVGYSSCSSSTYGSAEYSFHAATDAKSTMEGGYIYAIGQSSYDNSGSGRNRWGDFSYTFLDPVNNSFWTDQEYAYTSQNTWATSLANIAGTPCKGKPTAGLVSTSTDTLCIGDATVLNLTGYSNNATGIQITWQQSANGLNGWKTATGGIGDSTDMYTTAALTNSTYYRSVVRCIGAGLADTSAAIKIIIKGVTSVSLSNDTLCTPGNITLTANTVGAPVNWYSSNTSAKSIATGNVLNAYISKDTTFYVNTGRLNYKEGGIADNSGTGSYFNYTFDDGLLFNAVTNFTLDSVFIYADATGNVTVNLVDVDNGTTVSSVTITVTAGEVNNKTVVPTNFTCLGGTNYNITASGTTVDALWRTSDGAVFPYTIPGVLSINGPNNGAAGHYYFFYDWRVSSGCTSSRVPVKVNFYSLPMVAKASSDTLCSGGPDSVLLVASGANSYQWSTNNKTGDSIYVLPTASATYTVTGTNTKGCTGTATIAVKIENCTDINSPQSVNSSLDVYPNPTAGEFDLVMNNLPNQAYSVFMYNMIGQQIMKKQMFVTSSQNVTPINVIDLPPGVYFIRAVSGALEWTQRVIKR